MEEKLKYPHRRWIFFILLTISFLPVHSTRLIPRPRTKPLDLSFGKCLEKTHLGESELNHRFSFAPKKTTAMNCKDVMDRILISFGSFLQHSSVLNLPSRNFITPKNSNRCHFSTFDRVSRITFSSHKENSNKETAGDGSGNVVTSTVKTETPVFWNCLRGIFRHSGWKQPSANSKIAKHFLENILDIKSRGISFGKSPFRAHTFLTPSMEAHPEELKSILRDTDTFKIRLKSSSLGSTKLPGMKISQQHHPTLKQAPAVAKRRRQSLSINNALMTLTDMIQEYGRQKLIRNRDNLRYHMYVQG